MSTSPSLAVTVGVTQADLIAMAHRDFWCFVELVFHVLHPCHKLVHADYLDVMAWLIMGIEQGKYRRVIINLPPRHMKSLVVSVLNVAWRLGRDPAAKFITISYGDDLAHDHSGLTRALMMSPIYRSLFPGTVLDKRAVDYIRTTKGGYRYATSVGSDITGFGADVIIVDDPMQPDDAASEQTKEKLRSWISSSVLTRFNDPTRGVLILVMHRLAPDDLSATLEPQADFVLKLPLVAEAGEKGYQHNGKLLMRRQPREVLNPVRMSAAEVEELKASLPRYVWDSQYQQRPSAGGSGMLSIGWFRRYDLKTPPQFELIIQSWDVGATINGNASVCTKWGLVTEPDGRTVLYLTNVISLKLELPEVRAAIRAEGKADKPALIVIDERGDIESTLVRPPEVDLDSTPDLLLVFLGAERRPGAVLADQIGNHRIGLGDMAGVAPPQPVIQIPGCFARLVQLHRRKLADQMPTVVTVVIQGGCRLLDVCDKPLDVRIPVANGAGMRPHDGFQEGLCEFEARHDFAPELQRG